MNTVYLQKVRALLDKLEANMLPAVEEVAEQVAACTARGGMIYFFGTGHSHMIAEEPFYRAGGMANVSPLLRGFLMLHESASQSSLYERLEGVGSTLIDHSELKEGDVLFVISNSGRNAACIDAALSAKKKGAVTVAITSLSHSGAVSSRHSSGKRLFEVCDHVLDNGGELGDACVRLDGLESAIGPTSTVIDATLVNLVMSAACEKLLQRGIAPEVFTSANTDEGDRKNAALMEKYKSRISIL